MASAAASAGPAPSGGGGPLSFMGCMREASPPPYEDQPPPPHQHYNNRPVGLPTGEFAGQIGGHGFDSMPKEPKKRRFHPLRGLRRIFRKKSRGAADARLAGGSGPERDPSCSSGDEHRHHRVGLRGDREEVTLRDPAGRADEIRSRSASELLTDAACDRDRLFLRRRGIEESFANLQRGSGQLSVSHDSVFPGEVGHTRPLSSLDLHASLERRTAKASNNDTDHKDTHSAQRNRISLRVFEQIKTVIENRNQIAAAGPTTTETANSLHNRFSSRDRSERNAAAEDTQAKIPRKDAPAPTNTPAPEVPSSPLKEELPEPTSSSLNHTAAMHRISVRPKNRRPPVRRPQQASSNLNTSTSSSTSNGLPRIDSISENSIDTLDSLEAIVPVLESSSAEPQPEPSKPIPILRKSSSRLSRNSEVFEELEAKLPVIRKPAVSPDSLESNLDSRSSADVLDAEELKLDRPKPSPRSTSTGSEGYEKSPSPAVSSPRRRTSSNRLSKSPDSLESSSPGWFSKSSEGFDKLSDFEREAKPIAATRRLLVKPISKSQERVCCSKSSDSLEALEALNSDDSMERRRSSFEIRPRRNQVHKIMSKSTECFDSTLVELQEPGIKIEEKRKRASVSEMNLSRGSSSGSGNSSSRYSKLLSKSSESFEKISNLPESQQEKTEEPEKPSSVVWRHRRVAHSSESSDNLELDDNCKLENRNKARRSTPKRLSSGSNGNFIIDEQERKPTPRLQKSSESSELGSTDTLDSERRNTMKSSDSDETLDSLEKDLQAQPPEQDKKDEETTTESVIERREKNNEDEEVGSYWRRRANSYENKDKEINNMDILAYALASRIHENGNNDEQQHNEDNQREEDRTSGQVSAKTQIHSGSPLVVYPKKKQHQQQSTTEDNKVLSSTINNLISSRTDEDLQNMLNGNISEVSTDTKSFKEKLIMFEKLGK